MRLIEIDNVKVYFTHERPLNIFDERGILFYSSDFVKDFNGLFSLPIGKYYSSNIFTETKKSVNHFKKVILPKKERDYKHNWNEFKIYFSDNPNKCTIDHTNKTIMFDYSFKEAPQYIIDFILLHEMGHNYFVDEYKADLYAVKHMLKRGYNTAQIALCPLLALSSKNNNRKERVIQLLTNKSHK